MKKSNSCYTGSILAAMVCAHILPTTAQADGFQIITPNETAVSVADGLVTASLSSDGCTAGFESACTATRQRAEYQTTAAQAHGDRVSYSWEVMVDPGMVFKAADKHLYATRFVTGDDRAVLQFYLGTDYGYEVNRKTCFAPEAFGEWHKVEVRVVWDSTKKKGLKDKTPGEIHIACNGEEIFSNEGRPNIKEGDDIRFALGLEGAIAPADGDQVMVSFRNIEVGTW